MPELEIIMAPDDAPVFEQSNSPDITWSTEKVIVVRIWRGPYDKTRAMVPPMGGFCIGGAWNGLRIQDAKLVPEKGGLGVLTVRAEGSLRREEDGTEEQPLPPDDCGIVFTQVDSAVQEHPRYRNIPDNVLAAVEGYIHGANDKDRSDSEGTVLTYFTWDDYQLALELAAKLRERKTHFMTFPPVYVWTVHSFEEPTPNPGGYKEEPFGPLTPPPGWVWFRRGDEVKDNGTSYQITRSWQGSFEVDEDIYPVGPYPGE